MTIYFQAFLHYVSTRSGSVGLYTLINTFLESNTCKLIIFKLLFIHLIYSIKHFIFQLQIRKDNTQTLGGLCLLVSKKAREKYRQGTFKDRRKNTCNLTTVLLFFFQMFLPKALLKDLLLCFHTKCFTK